MKQTDIYTEALVCLRLILQTDHPEFKLRIGPSGGRSPTIF